MTIQSVYCFGRQGTIKPELKSHVVVIFMPKASSTLLSVSVVCIVNNAP